jgi:hypothetical protein
MSTIMRFVVFYRNRPEVRRLVEEQLLANYKKVNFAAQLVKTHLFSTALYWPSTAELLNLPMNTQCEEVEIKDGKLVSINLAVIDVEVITVSEVTPTEPPAKP